MPGLRHMIIDPRQGHPAVFNVDRTNPENRFVQDGINGFLERLKMIDSKRRRQSFGEPPIQKADKQRHVLALADIDHAIDLIDEVL